MTNPAHSLIAAVLSAALASPASALDSPATDPITPYRPSVSNPAQLPAPGQLEVEFGGLHAGSAGAHRNALPYLLKLGFDAQWGVLIGGESHVWQQDDSGSASGVGDTTLTLKRAWRVDEATAFGAELTATLPTADHRIGSGRADLTLNTLFSRDLGNVHMDANLNATRLGAPDADTGRTLVGASAAFSTPLADQWGVTGELSGTRQTGAGTVPQVLAALTWSPSKRLTFDLGAARAWRPGTTRLFTGVVFPIARLW